MHPDFTRNYFDLFGLPPRFELDIARLEQGYRELQSQVHPDRFTHLPEADRRISMQWATQVNEAYRTLKSPLLRAQYVLGLRGQDAQAESNTTMPAQFLIEQMEWREAVAEARAGDDVEGLEQLAQRVRHLRAACVAEIADRLDHTPDDQAACAAVRRLMFIDKLEADILDALESLD